MKQQTLLYRLVRSISLWVFVISLVINPLSSVRDLNVSTIDDRQVQVVEENGRYVLYRHGKPFQIKGGAGERHLDRLQAMGGNTIRIYDTLNLGEKLDSAHAHDLAVIVGIWMMGEDEMDYTDSFKVVSQYEAIGRTVNKHKDHPALLMWCLGNEISYRVEWSEYYSPKDVWLAFGDLVDLIHEIDPDHPVTTTITNFQKKRLLYFKMYVPQLDIVAINTFGKLKGLEEETRLWRWFFNKPYFLAEWAIRGPWEAPETPWYTPLEENSSEKALEYRKFYEQYIPHEDPHFLGSCVFYWGQKQEHTHTWFGLFSENGEETQSMEALSYSWSGKLPDNYAPRVRSLCLENMGQKDTLIFSRGRRLTATLETEDPDGNTPLVTWEILPDQWHFDYRAINYKPRAIEGLIETSGTDEVIFTAPREAGSYRLFATIRDTVSNKIATANIPFLIE